MKLHFIRSIAVLLLFCAATVPAAAQDSKKDKARAKKAKARLKKEKKTLEGQTQKKPIRLILRSGLKIWKRSKVKMRVYNEILKT